MPTLAEVVDAVVGIDTHRDIHVAELAGPTGATLATIQIANSSSGYAELLGWIAEHAPGPQVVAAVEGTRSFGVGVSRALSAAGLPIIECEQPTRTSRRGRGKSDSIDAHLAARSVLALDADRLPTPRADGAREDCASCSAPARNSAPPPRHKPTACARCCSPARIATATSAGLP